MRCRKGLRSQVRGTVEPCQIRRWRISFVTVQRQVDGKKKTLHNGRLAFTPQQHLTHIIDLFRQRRADGHAVSTRDLSQELCRIHPESAEVSRSAAQKIVVIDRRVRRYLTKQHAVVRPVTRVAQNHRENP